MGNSMCVAFRADFDFADAVQLFYAASSLGSRNSAIFYTYSTRGLEIPGRTEVWWCRLRPLMISM
ncbi:hypothetical protein B0H17DRAFT_1072758 [Mycena rosella]|uniref:Uncharacterized protein n=1 Tax=Mycena rosella TaxID=1033263 RepID=A0AAD7D9D9_MYCRO|nr:hypothetical protein B0H17DRAFT_1072758 [Mycena rosella]